MNDISTLNMNSLLQTANDKLGMDRLAKTSTGLSNKDAEKTKKAAEDFEAVFISEMLKPMFETIEVSDTFGGGKGEEIFRGIMIQEMGKSIARNGGLGIAANVQAHLLKAQENPSNTSSETTGA